MGSVVALEPNDYAAWYSQAACLRNAQGVVRDAVSPTGWRFVASYEQSLRAYEQAFRLRPALMHGLGNRALSDLLGIFVISSARVRVGVASPPDSGTFGAYPTSERDTIAYYPVPRSAALLGAPPEGVALAIQRQRERLSAVSRLWREEFPGRADAAEAVAVALELLGNSAALDTLRLARTLSTDPVEALRIATTEVLVAVKYSIPDNISGIVSAVALADSLLTAHPPAHNLESRTLGTLAALLGRGGLAAAYATAGGVGTVAPAMAQSGPKLLAFASVGGPVDTVRALERRAMGDAGAMPEPARTGAKAQWIVRAAALAYPDVVLEILSAPPSLASAGMAVSVAAFKHDRAALDRTLQTVARNRQNLRAGEVMIDGIFPEAAALAAIGEVRIAVARLDPTLDAVRLMAAGELAQIPRGGTLTRALALRATLADALGDHTSAKRYAGAVVALWSGADPFLQATVKKMQALAR